MSNEVHIIAPFIYANGGDWRAIDLYLEYSKTRPVKLWSSRAPNQQLAQKYPIQEIRPFSGISPNNGTLIISGTRTELGQWYEHASFERVILFHNLVAPNLLYSALNRLSLDGKRNVEVIYVSELVKQLAGLSGKVSYHLPHPKRFQPLAGNTPINKDNFVVGRASMDYLAKYHHEDIDLYKKLAAENIEIKILGGQCLTPWLEKHPKINLLPAAPQAEMASFYSSLDCFHYRVSSVVKEAYGFVVIEAMRSGLPVVCHREVGASELIEHGVNGFVYSTNQEAQEIISTLKKNANLCKKVGMNAQLSLEKLRDHNYANF